MLDFLYKTVPGRVILKGLTAPGLSKTAGWLMDQKVSKVLIKPFVENNGIDLSEYAEEEYGCFNDCFCRHIRPEMRPLNMDPNVLMSPCDGLLSVYPMEKGLIIPVKESHYSIADLLRNKPLADEYEGGQCLVFRLCVNHYHRYAYPDSGSKGRNIFIPGILHTVRPVALRSVPVFTENSREYTVLDTDHFGKVVQMEVGAMLVGKIANLQEEGSFERGQEKGRFLYGGSTIILLLKKDAAVIDDEIIQTTQMGEEYPVVMGQRLGLKKQ